MCRDVQVNAPCSFVRKGRVLTTQLFGIDDGKLGAHLDGDGQLGDKGFFVAQIFGNGEVPLQER